jgi:hypothetical protein
MPRVINLLWRLDYSPSFAYLDKRGSALRVLNDLIKDYWNSVGVSANLPLSFVAQHSSVIGFRVLSLEPSSMNGAIEWKSGIDLDRVLQDEAFRGTDKIVHDLLKLCEVRVMIRAGVRVICVAKFADGRGQSLRRASKLLDQELRQQTKRVLGEINDIGITFEGIAEDGLSYRSIFGPYARKNVDITLQNKPDESQYKELDNNDLFFDMDLFENNISFAEHSLFRWANTKIAKAAEFLKLWESANMESIRA